MTSVQSKGGIARKNALTPKQRTAIARKAAKARWENNEMPARKTRSNGRVQAHQRDTFGDALVQAQQQLAEAQHQLNYHQYEYSRLLGEIPNLQRTVHALQQLRGQQQPQFSSYPPGPTITYYPQAPAPSPVQPLPPNYSLETIMSDAPLPTETNPNPPSMTFVMPPPPPAVPPARPPVPSMVEMPKPPLPPRGGGGAIGKPLEDEDEDQFLKAANNDPNNPAGGAGWK